MPSKIIEHKIQCLKKQSKAVKNKKFRIDNGPISKYHAHERQHHPYAGSKL